MSRREQLQILLDPETVATLRRLRLETGLPVSRIVREVLSVGIPWWEENRKPERPGR